MEAREDDLRDYAVDESIGRGLPVLLVIKGFDQLNIVKRIAQRDGQRAFGLTAAPDAFHRTYSCGAIAAARLDAAAFDDVTLGSARYRVNCREPFSVAFRADTMIYTAGYELRVVDLVSGDVRAITHDWLSFAHTVDISTDGARVLTASAGFDTVLELKLEDSALEWQWTAWDHGFERSRVGQSYVTRDAGRAAELQALGREVIVVGDPTAWPREGLPTPLSPVRLNGAYYDVNDDILLTFYHRSELAVVSRDGSCTLFSRGLSHPHGFRRTRLLGHDAYAVTNSGAGEYLLLDTSFQPTRAIRFGSLPANEEKRKSFGEWIQNVTVLDPERGLLAAVDAMRSGVHIVDLATKRRRFIANPENWTLNAVVPIPPEGRLLA